MKTSVLASIAAAALLLAACDLRYALLGFPQPRAFVTGEMPVDLAYREAKGGLVILRGRVNDSTDVDFILDTGAPVSVLIDGPRTRGLGLDTSAAKPLGDPGNPGTPIGIIQGGFQVAFGTLALTQLTAVVVPEKTMPCREKFDEIGKSCYVNGMREERAGAPVSVTIGTERIEVASPVYSSDPNAVDGSRASTIGIGLFKDRRLIIDYPGSRLVLG